MPWPSKRSTSQPCEVGAAGGWGLWVMVALPEGTGSLRDLLTSSVPPLPSRCHQGLAPGHAARRAGQQTNKQQETAPVTTANKDLFGVIPSLSPPLPSSANSGHLVGLSWDRLWQMPSMGASGPRSAGRGQSVCIGHSFPFPHLQPRREKGWKE